MGLFDSPSSAQVKRALQDRAAQQDMSYAQMRPGRGMVRLAAQSGRMLGDSLETLAGYEEPELVKARKLEDLKRRSMNLNVEPGSPEYFRAVRDMAQAEGLTDIAMEADTWARKREMESLEMQKYERDLETESSPFSKINPKDYTQESIQRFNITGDYGDLEPVGKGKAERMKASDFGLRDDEYVVIRQPSGTVKIISRKTGGSATIKEDENGQYFRIQNGQFAGYVTDDEGNPITSGAHARTERRQTAIQARSDRKEARLERKHADKILGEYADDYRTDTQHLKDMDEEIQAALTILDKPEDEFSSYDAKQVQRMLSAVKKAGTRAKTEIDAWQPGEIGNIVERIEGKLAGFFKGKYSREEINQAVNSLRYLQYNYIDPSYEGYNEFYRKKAERRDLPADEVIRPRHLGRAEGEPKGEPIPVPGEERDGYEFIGGDPNNKANWKPK